MPGLSDDGPGFFIPLGMLLRIILFFFFMPVATVMANHTNIMDTTKFKKQLNVLTSHLLYSSESDYPFELLDWGKVEPDKIKLAIAAKHPAGSTLEAVPAKDFFSRYIHRQEMSDDEAMKDIAGRYKKLESFLLANAVDLIVWRCGRIEIGVYIVISLKNGHVLALKTTAIET